MASDGRWYPPELHPSRRAASPSPAPPAPAAPPVQAAPPAPFRPIPAVPPLTPLSMRQSMPHRFGAKSVTAPASPAGPVPPLPKYTVQTTVDRASRPDLALGPASLTNATRRHRSRSMPLGSVFLVVVVLLGVGVGFYWYNHRVNAHSSAVNAAEAFVTDIYGGSLGSAQSMLLPGQSLTALTHPFAPVSFGVGSVTRHGLDEDVNLVVCTTGNGRGCGAQSGNGVAAVVPTREVDGRWYVDQSLFPPCPGTGDLQQVVVCQN